MVFITAHNEVVLLVKAVVRCMVRSHPAQTLATWNARRRLDQEEIVAACYDHRGKTVRVNEQQQHAGEQSSKRTTLQIASLNHGSQRPHANLESRRQGRKKNVPTTNDRGFRERP